MNCVSAGKPPLYFQHEGHSRTIIGIERYKPTQGKAKRQADSSASSGNEGYLYNLLLLDPSHKTKDLIAALKSGKGWQVRLAPVLAPLLSVVLVCLRFCAASGFTAANAQSPFSRAHCLACGIG